MEDPKNQLNKTFEYLKEFWFIVLFIGTTVVGWTTISNQVKYNDIRISSLENRASQVDSVLSQIASDLSFIRGKMEGK